MDSKKIGEGQISSSFVENNICKVFKGIEWKISHEGLNFGDWNVKILEFFLSNLF